MDDVLKARWMVRESDKRTESWRGETERGSVEKGEPTNEGETLERRREGRSGG